MSRERSKHRRHLMYDDPVECGIFSATKDRRIPDETRTVSEVHRSPVQIATYAIFAGHGGAAAAELCARNFVPTLLTDSVLKRDPERAIRNACQAQEAFVLAKSALDCAYYGTTLLFTMIYGQKVYIANIGNSRAVLATKDGAQAITQEHDGSNSEEVARVTEAGGFFQDGKVNNLIPITRSIGDLELKDRKHITFPNRKMTGDIIIGVPDIYQRRLSPRDEFLVMASSEVWKNLSNNVVVQTIKDSLKRGDNPRTAAKKVVQAAVSAGARRSITVMILIFPTSTRRGHDKSVAPPSSRRGSRPSSIKRHSSNAEQELRSAKHVNNVPAFVLAAQAQEQNRAAVQRNVPDSSPITSPSGQALRSPIGHEDVTHKRDEQLASTPFLSLNALAGSSSNTSAYPKRQQEKKAQPEKSGTLRYKSRAAVRGHTVLGTTAVGPQKRNDQESFPQRHREVTRPPPVVIEQRIRDGVDPFVSPRAKTATVSRISELTASGATMGRDSSHGLEETGSGTGQPFDDAPGLADFNSAGPSKVRYREDGTVHTTRFGFWRELGRTFGRRK
ncbi:phosphatase 2C 49 [Gracilariopsis chorda]|uniref:Phosphatase 2C 49 n=1 Tax=Gracilariopsis chorda TaxID=448386 RepID=A0A2V3IYH4_9FLOR|nr:phosphatase 2C 49 [Gracilariopsis chorda]|eukprot:PXF47113.1 phosphatase 2C 49 [Gracilariopsis chorda]